MPIRKNIRVIPQWVVSTWDEEKVPQFPIRQDLTVLGADEPKEKLLGFRVFEKPWLIPPGTIWIWKEQEPVSLADIRKWGQDKFRPREQYEIITGKVVPEGTAYVECEAVDRNMSVQRMWCSVYLHTCSRQCGSRTYADAPLAGMRGFPSWDCLGDSGDFGEDGGDMG